uniref:Nuclear receptor n=1 Tax=Caenorhabditis tropicalis TaxID=1561998 RepID=A0A1I7UWJ9_9PELO
MELLENSLSICKICGLIAHGVHFGVMTCRACAAFFRRYVVLNLKYDCLKDEKRCSLDKIRRNSCRQCRYQKCIQMGMTPDNVQWNRDITITDRRSRNVKKQEVEESEECLDLSISKPSTSLCAIMKAEDNFYTTSILSEINYDNLDKVMHEIFVSDIPSTTHGYFASLNPLYRFVEGLKLVRKPQRTETIEFENRLSMETLLPHWRAQAKHTAILSMHSMAFRNISLTEKSRIYKTIWQNIYRLERIQMSTEIFGGKCVSEKKLAISCEKAIQLDSLFFDIEGVARNNLRLSLQDYKAFAERCVEEVAKPLGQLHLSIEEVAFLILNFVLHNEESIRGESLVICNEFRDNIANDLHEYYLKNDVVNYAPRIRKIMNIVVAMKKIHYDDLGGKFIMNAKRASRGE